MLLLIVKVYMSYPMYGYVNDLLVYDSGHLNFGSPFKSWWQ